MCHTCYRQSALSLTAFRGEAHRLGPHLNTPLVIKDAFEVLPSHTVIKGSNSQPLHSTVGL